MLALFAVALAVYLYGALHSPVLDRRLVERDAYLAGIIREGSIDMAEERRFAELYWDAYPHVGGDRYFGRDGAMGVLGAREHYNRHGRREGLLWGDELAPRMTPPVADPAAAR